MHHATRFMLIIFVFSTAALACVESDDQIDDIDQDPQQVEPEQADPQQSDSPDNLLGAPVEPNDEVPADLAGEETSDQSPVQVKLLAGKQPNHPSAWLAHAAANESECGHTSCPYTVRQQSSEPEAIPPFERAEECMLGGGVAVEGGETYVANAEAGAAQGRFTTDVSSGEDFVELSLSGEAIAEIPTAGGVRSDAGATLYTDETAMVLDIANPSEEPVELEVSWDLSGEPVRGEASWQGSLWFTGNASRLDECYVAPDYQYDRVFDVYQDVGGDVRGEASGSVRLPIADQAHNQVGLRLNVGAHAVGREGSRPELAQGSQSQVQGTLRFRVVPAGNDTGAGDASTSDDAQSNDAPQSEAPQGEARQEAQQPATPSTVAPSGDRL